MTRIRKLWANKDFIVSYLKWSLAAKPPDTSIKPLHIIFLFVDHFEPKFDRERGGQRFDDDTGFQAWVNEYPKLASKHRDADGRHPQHTWFYPYDHMNIRHLERLSMLVRDGFGEIELHLHHRNDTSKSLEQKLRDAIVRFNQVGALITCGDNPVSTYGFIHGKWALDNCDGTCGVNDEISILLQTGYYADFGLPAQNSSARPKVVNRIYYAIDDPMKPKSFDSGPEVTAGTRCDEGLMMIPGPFRIDWRDWRFKWHPMVEEGEIRRIRQPTNNRVDLWIDTNIHVPGRPDWIFVKVFTHGAVEEDLETLLGPPADNMYDYLENRYNDGHNYKLHYVTAREAFNLIKAAEAGKCGDPDLYRDFIIKPYLNRLGC